MLNVCTVNPLQKNNIEIILHISIKWSSIIVMVMILLSWHLPKYISHFGHKLWSNTLDKLKPIVKYNTTKKYTSFNKNNKNAKKINSKQKLIMFFFSFLFLLKNFILNNLLWYVAPTLQRKQDPLMVSMTTAQPLHLLHHHL